ncbi:MAG: M12 family metallo-peptidase [Planctomycetota bacterium]
MLRALTSLSVVALSGVGSSMASEIPLSSIQGVTIATHAGHTARVAVELDGHPHTLVLAPTEVRGDDFRIQLVGVDGAEFADVPSAAVGGYVEGVPGSVVAGSLHEGRLTATIDLPDLVGGPERFAIQPARDGTARHFVYATEDLPHVGGTCGVDHADAIPLFGDIFDAHLRRSLQTADISFEVDNPLYLDFGSDVAAITAEVEALAAALDVIYERDVSVDLRLSQIVIRASADPYTSTDPSTLVEQFRTEWDDTQPDDIADIAHLLSGRDFDGTTIGLAEQGSICSGVANGVNEWQAAFDRTVGLVAHEIGHNFNAMHCDTESECRIMCTTLGFCDGFGDPIRFSPAPIASMGAQIASESCFDTGVDGFETPFVEDFTDFFNLGGARWRDIFGVFLFSGSVFPSPPSGALLSGDAELQTVPIDLNGASSATLSYQISASSSAGVETLDVEYFDRVSRTWVILEQVATGDLGAQFDFFLRTIDLPAEARAARNVVRFRAPGSSNGFFLDDVSLTAELATDCPADIDEPFGVLDLADIDAFIGAFLSGGTAADIAAPFGVIDLADIDTFIATFLGGCP